MSAAATYEQHLLVGDEGGVVYLFNIPDSGAWGASEKLRPSTTYHEHQSTIMACDMSAKHSVTGEKNGKVNCWILGQEAPVWTVNTKEQIFDVRFTSSNKVVVLTNDGKLNLHFQVIDQGEILFDQRYFYDNKCFDFAYADELKINSLERVSAVNFSLGKLGILDVSDPQKPTTRSMNHSYKIEGKSEPGKRLMLFSRDSFFCVLKKCKAQKNWRLTICKNDAQDSEIEYPKKTL